MEPDSPIPGKLPLWKSDFVNSDITGDSSHYVEIAGKRYWAHDAEEIARLHNESIAPGEAVGRETKEQESEAERRLRIIATLIPFKEGISYIPRSGEVMHNIAVEYFSKVFPPNDKSFDAWYPLSNIPRHHRYIAEKAWKAGANFAESLLSTLRRERDQLKAECQPHFAMRVDLSAEFAAKMARLESQVRELAAQNQELRGEKAKEIAAMMLPEEISRATQLAKLMYNADHFKVAYEDHLKICPGPPMLLPSCYIEQNKTIAELRDTVEKMQKVLEQMLASASPNPKEHPTMTVAWANARRELSDMRKGSL